MGSRGRAAGGGGFVVPAEGFASGLSAWTATADLSSGSLMSSSTAADCISGEMRCFPVSFYFRVGGSVASCRASFRSPVSVMADLFDVFLFLRWQKEEDGRHKKEKVSPLRLQECWPPFVGLLFSSLLPGVCLCTPSVCLCGLLYEASCRSGVENLDYTRFLDDQVVFQRACNLMMMYSAMI